MQHERFVRRGAMQVNRCAEHGGLNEDGGHDKRENNGRKQKAPPRKSRTRPQGETRRPGMGGDYEEVIVARIPVAAR